MTKKDYELIANVFNGYLAYQIEDDKRDLTIEEIQAEEQAHRDLAAALAIALGQENTKFDRDKFLTACGIKD